MIARRCDGKKICFPQFSAEDNDLALLKWRLNHGYAVTNIRVDGDQITVSAHRMVLERMAARKLAAGEICDHINHDRLDCRRLNLRLVNCSQSSQNRCAHNAIGIRGVTRHKQGKWQAQVTYKRQFYYCGLFDDPIEAGKAAKEKRKELGFLGA